MEGRNKTWIYFGLRKCTVVLVVFMLAYQFDFIFKFQYAHIKQNPGRPTRPSTQGLDLIEFLMAHLKSKVFSYILHTLPTNQNRRVMSMCGTGFQQCTENDSAVGHLLYSV